MKKILILAFCILFAVALVFWYLSFNEITSITRSENNAYNLSLSKLKILKNSLINGINISRKQAIELFSPVDVTKNESLLEMRLRANYRDYSDSKISLTALLLMLSKENFLYNIDENNILKVKSKNYNSDDNSFAWNYGFLFLPNDTNKKLIFIKLDKITGRINIEKSYIGNKNLVELLNVDKNGKITDKAIESKFLNFLKKQSKSFVE